MTERHRIGVGTTGRRTQRYSGPTKEYLATKGLLSSRVSLEDLARRSATYIDRIRKGPGPRISPSSSRRN